MKFQTASQEDMQAGEGNYLKVPGTFHMTVDQIHDGKKPNGDMFDGVTVVLEVVDGTVRNEGGCTEKGKTKTLYLGYPAMKMEKHPSSQHEMDLCLTPPISALTSL